MSLSGTQVTDANLAHLGGLTTLKELRLYWTQITDAGLAHLAGLTALERLDLDDTQVSGSGLVHLAGDSCGSVARLPDRWRSCCPLCQ